MQRKTTIYQNKLKYVETIIHNKNELKSTNNIFIVDYSTCMMHIYMLWQTARLPIYNTYFISIMRQSSSIDEKKAPSWSSWLSSYVYRLYQHTRVLWFESLFNFFFYLSFLSWTYSNHRTAGEGDGVCLTPHHHFHPLHRHLDINLVIIAVTN